MAVILRFRSQLRTPSPGTSRDLPCQQTDPALWFSSVPAELNLAKAYCGGCRIRQQCLAGALDRAEPTGVWGGEIFDHGRIIEFKRGRGRPRRVDAIVNDRVVAPPRPSLSVLPPPR